MSPSPRQDEVAAGLPLEMDGREAEALTDQVLPYLYEFLKGRRDAPSIGPAASDELMASLAGPAPRTGRPIEELLPCRTGLLRSSWLLCR